MSSFLTDATPRCATASGECTAPCPSFRMAAVSNPSHRMMFPALCSVSVSWWQSLKESRNSCFHQGTACARTCPVIRYRNRTNDLESFGYRAGRPKRSSFNCYLLRELVSKVFMAPNYGRIEFTCGTTSLLDQAHHAPKWLRAYRAYRL